MIRLTPYHCGLWEPMTARIAAFDVWHAGLVGRSPDSGALRRAAETLEEWVRDSILLVIEQDGRDVGFLRMSRFPIVVKIEDLFVDEAQRGQGIATRALELAEEYARSLPGVEAAVLDVVPRNEGALRLYRKLGYDSLCMVTLRKEFGPNPRDRACALAGLDFLM